MTFIVASGPIIASSAGHPISLRKVGFPLLHVSSVMHYSESCSPFFRQSVAPSIHPCLTKLVFGDVPASHTTANAHQVQLGYLSTLILKARSR